MGTGSEVSASNKTASFDIFNHKTRLIDTGTAIQAASKAGAGQEAYATSTSGGLSKGTDLITDPTGTLWTNKLSNLLWTIKWGTYQPSSATFLANLDGLYQTGTLSGSLALGAIDVLEGLPSTFTSGASAGNQCGFNMGIGFTNRSFNPHFKLRWKLDEAGANIRFFAGFAAGTSTIANSDDPLNAFNGFGVGIQTTQANYRILHNDGVGATASQDTTIAKDVSYHTIELWGDENGAAWWWSLDGSTPVSRTSDIPVGSTTLNAQFIATAVNADAKIMHVIRSLVTSDK